MKAGDKYRVIANTFPKHYYKIGDIVTVVYDKKDGTILFKGDVLGDSGTIPDCVQELVSNDVEPADTVHNELMQTADALDPQPKGE